MSAWTRERPTQAGWYWWRKPRVEPMAYQVIEIGKYKKRLYVCGCGEIDEFKGGEWQPVQGPRE